MRVSAPRSFSLTTTASLGFALLLAAAGCDSRIKTGGGTGADPNALANLTSIDVGPADLQLVTSDGAPATAEFIATGHFANGKTMDVTSRVSWSLADAGLGAVTAGHFTATTLRGGDGTVIAAAPGVMASAPFTLKLQRTRVSTDDGSTAPPDSAMKFAGGTVDPALAPVVVYPLDGALLPPNLGEIEVQWQAGKAAADLYEVSFQSDTLDLKVYTNATRPGGGRLVLGGADWAALANSLPGKSVKVSVQARSATNPMQFGQSAGASAIVGRDEVAGGIYYWSASTGPNGEGIQRHAFGNTSEMAKPFFTEFDGGAVLGGKSHCVACHVLSRDGTRFAITFDGGDGVSAIIDVATKKQLVPAAQGVHWNFAALSPDGARMVASSHGVLTLYDTTTGKPQGTVTPPGGLLATHPDWSPDGKHIVFVGVPPAAFASDWSFTQGSIAIATDDGNGAFPNPRVLVHGAADNNYYPSFSPDNNWILFNRSLTNSYSAPDASLYVIAADGKSPAVHLTAADGTGPLSNSWARWSPFVQKNGPDGDLLYFTFSSKRAYGIEIPAGRPQIWMAAFSPKSGGEMAGPPYSFAPFWLPFQDPGTSNHIAQWTTTIVGVQ